jgi:F-type H+-transporting ATPase subunit d
LANPEAAPKIDWAYYKTRVAVPGMVETFQKQYEALKIPYPADTVTSQVEAQEKESVWNSYIVLFT